MARRVILFIAAFPSYGGARDRGSEAALSTFKHLPPPVTSVCAGKLATPGRVSLQRSPGLRIMRTLPPVL